MLETTRGKHSDWGLLARRSTPSTWFTRWVTPGYSLPISASKKVVFVGA